MKKIILIGSLFFITCNVSTAQSSYKKKTLEERSAKFTKEITDYVSNITPAQNTALLEINKQVTQQFDSLKALHLESDEYKPAARNVFKTRDMQIKALLDAKQFDEFMMLQAEKREAAYNKKNITNLTVPQQDSTKKNYRKQFSNEPLPVISSAPVAPSKK
jgi:hypothetical protein